MIDGWASTTPDADFIRGAVLWWPMYEHELAEQQSSPFQKELNKTIAADARKRPERKAIQMIQNALKESLPFDDKQVDAGIMEILNTEIDSHKIDLGGESGISV